MMYSSINPCRYVPTFDPKASLPAGRVLNDMHGNAILTSDGDTPLANADKRHFDVDDLKKIYICTDKGLNFVSPDQAKDLFLEWVSIYHMCLWRPVKKKVVRFNINTLAIDLDGSTNEKAVIMRNLRVGANDLEVGDVIYALPPLLVQGIAKTACHRYTISGDTTNVYLHPMLLTQKDYEDLEHDLTLAHLLNDIDGETSMKTIGKSCLKQHLSIKDMKTVARFIKRLHPVGTVLSPVDNKGSSVPGVLAPECTIKHNQRFRLQYKIM